MSSATVAATTETRTAPEPSTPRPTWQFWRSPLGQPYWARPSLLAVMIATAVLYSWNITHMQLNLYFSAGVKTMSQSWPAWLSGAYDPQLTITLDKTPGTFWLQALSARIFGFSPWAVLLPSLVASIVSVLLLYRLVYRWQGAAAGLAAAGFLAATPMAAAVARTEHPDPVLLMCLLAAAAAWQAALAENRLGPLLWSGVWVGLAFNVKMAQAWLIWIPLGTAWLAFAAASWRRRAGHLAAAGAVTLAVSLAWPVSMALTPATSRPWIDGSVDNSVWSMIFGYNGFNRYAIDNLGADVLGIGGPTGKSEGPAWLYWVRDGVAPQVGWLYPLALAGLVAGLWAANRVARANWLMWLLWLGVHTVAFAASVKAHSFYNLALAPPLAALAGTGLVHVVRASRERWWPAPLTVAATGLWGWHLSGRFAFAAWLPAAVAAASAVAVVMLVAAAWPEISRSALPGTQARSAERPAGGRPWLALTAVATAMAAMLIAPVTWTLSVTDNVSVSDAHRPSAGPPSREIASILSGRMLRLLPPADITALAAYAREHHDGERYDLAVQWSPQAGQFITRGLDPLPVGGFTAQVPTITAEQLHDLVAKGELRFAVLDGPELKGKPTPDYPGYAAWARANCQPVPGYQRPLFLLYDCRPSH